MLFKLLNILLTLTINAIAQNSWTTTPFVFDEKCLYVVDAGPCKDKQRVWGYDPYAQKCGRFYYGGCGGNPNRFNTMHDCRVACVDPKRDYTKATTRKEFGSYDYYGNPTDKTLSSANYFDGDTPSTTTVLSTKHTYVDYTENSTALSEVDSVDVDKDDNDNDYKNKTDNDYDNDKDNENDNDMDNDNDNDMDNDNDNDFDEDKFDDNDDENGINNTNDTLANPDPPTNMQKKREAQNQNSARINDSHKIAFASDSQIHFSQSDYKKTRNDI